MRIICSNPFCDHEEITDKLNPHIFCPKCECTLLENKKMSNIGKLKWIWLWSVLGLGLAIWLVDSRITRSAYLNNVAIVDIDQRLTQKVEILSSQMNSNNKELIEKNNNLEIKIKPSCLKRRK